MNVTFRDYWWSSNKTNKVSQWKLDLWSWKVALHFYPASYFLSLDRPGRQPLPGIPVPCPLAGNYPVIPSNNCFWNLLSKVISCYYCKHVLRRDTIFSIKPWVVLWFGRKWDCLCSEHRGQRGNILLWSSCRSTCFSQNLVRDLRPGWWDNTSPCHSNIRGLAGVWKDSMVPHLKCVDVSFPDASWYLCLVSTFVVVPFNFPWQTIASPTVCLESPSNEWGSFEGCELVSWPL